MNHCPDSLELQDWLDGELAPAAAERLAAHVAVCAACAGEVAAFREVFAELRAVPLLDPRPELFERIMEQVLPHRMPRWVRVLGWAYAGAFAASLVALVAAFVLPGPSAWLHGVIAAGMRALTGTGTFVVRTLSDGFARLGAMLEGGGVAARMLGWLGTVMSQPVVFLTVLAALAACAGVLWWMRPRERDASREIPHVGMLGL